MAYKNFQNGTALTAEVMNDFIMEQTIARFANAAERNTAMPAPEVGQHCYLTSTNQTLRYEGAAGWVELVSAQLGGLNQRTIIQCTSTTRPAHAAGRMVFETDTNRVKVSDGTYWRLVSPEGNTIYDGTFAASNTNQAAATIQMATVNIPDPGYPYMLTCHAHSESGSVAAGTRFDSQVWALNQGIDTILGYSINQENQAWNRATSIGPVLRSGSVPFVGSSVVRYQIGRVYGSGNGGFSGFNQLLRVWVSAA